MRAPDPVCVDCGRPYPRRGGPRVTRCEGCEAKREHTERPTDRRLLVDYHERILATSESADRRHRSERALDRLRREQAEETDRLRRIEASAPPASTFDGQLQRRVRDREDDEFEVVWSGGEGLTSR